MQMKITGDQADALVEVLRDHNDGEDVLITATVQGEAFEGLRRPREIVVAFSLATVTIEADGGIEDN